MVKGNFLLRAGTVSIYSHSPLSPVEFGTTLHTRRHHRPQISVAFIKTWKESTNIDCHFKFGTHTCLHEVKDFLVHHNFVVLEHYGWEMRRHADIDLFLSVDNQQKSRECPGFTVVTYDLCYVSGRYSEAWEEARECSCVV